MTTPTPRPWVQSTLVGAEHQILAVNAGVVCEISPDYVEMVPLIVHCVNTYPVLVEALELLRHRIWGLNQGNVDAIFNEDLIVADKALALAKKGIDL